MFGADKDKSQLLFAHVLAAAQRHERKAEARDRLKAQLSKLGDLKMDDSVKRHLATLERNVNEVVSSERRMIMVQDSERRVNEAVAYRLGAIERDLQEWKNTHQRKERSLHDLERRIDSRVKNIRVVRKDMVDSTDNQKWKAIERAAVLRKVKSSVVALERLHRNLSHQKDVPKSKLAQVAKRIKSLKAMIKKVQ